jgi:hypothetical protein
MRRACSRSPDVPPLQVTLIVRLMTDDRQVLGWCELPAVTQGDGCLWALGVVHCVVQQGGVATRYNVHWRVLHVHQDFLLGEPMAVQAATAVPLRFTAPALRFASSPDPLPPLTVQQSVTVAPPTGTADFVGRTH